MVRIFWRAVSVPLMLVVAACDADRGLALREDLVASHVMYEWGKPNQFEVFDCNGGWRRLEEGRVAARGTYEIRRGALCVHPDRGNESCRDVHSVQDDEERLTFRESDGTTVDYAYSPLAGEGRCSPTRLTGDALRYALVGRTLLDPNPPADGVDRFSFHGDGSYGASGGGGEYLGRYAVQGDRYCVQLNHAPEEHCWALYRGAWGRLYRGRAEVPAGELTWLHKMRSHPGT